MTDSAHEQESFPNSAVRRLAAIEEKIIPDSFLIAVTTVPVTVGAEWVKLDGFVVGPQNFDLDVGPDVRLCDDGDGMDLLSTGHYHLQLNCQLTNPTVDGWFESAVQPSLPESFEWPTEDITGSHSGRWIPALAATYYGASLGANVGYTTPTMPVNSTVTGWCRYATEHGGDATPTGTIDVVAILYVVRVTS
jgi:hypothetical protein